MTALYLLNLALPGFLVSTMFFLRRTDDRVIDYAWIVRSLLWSISLISLVGIVLVELSSFRMPLIQAIFAVLNGGLLVANAVYAPWRKIRVQLPSTSFHALFALLLIVAALLRTPVSNYIFGGQDQGTYVNVANELAATGDILIHDELLAQTHADTTWHGFFREYFRMDPYAPLMSNGSSSSRTLGFYVGERETGTIVPQFYHLHPIWMALSTLLFGQEHTAWSLVLFSMLTIPLLYLLINWVIRRPYLSLFCTALYATNVLTVWVSRYPISEAVASCLFIAGIYYLCTLITEDDRELRMEHALLAGLSLGLFSFVRGDGLLLVPLIAIIYLFLPRRRDIFIAANLFFVLTAWSVAHALTLSFPYFFFVARYFGFGFLPMSIEVWMGAFALGIFVLHILKYRAAVFLAACAERCHQTWAKHQKALLLLIPLLFGIALLRLAQTPHPSLGVSELLSMVRHILLDYETYGNRLLQLIVLLNPLVSLLAIGGALVLWRVAPRAWPLVIIIIALFVAKYILVVDGRGLMYYGRYHYGTMYPFVFMLVGALLAYLWQHMRRGAAIVITLCTMVGASYVVPLLGNQLFYQTELEGSYEELAAIATAIDDNAVVFLGPNKRPEWNSWMGPPLMYSFRVGDTFRYKNIRHVFDVGGRLFDELGKPVYVFAVGGDTQTRAYGDYQLELIRRGTIPVQMSEHSTRIPQVLQAEQVPYTLYKLARRAAVDAAVVHIPFNTALYSAVGLHSFARSAAYTWTGPTVTMYDVPLYPDPGVPSQQLMLSLENAGYYPHELPFEVGVQINGEQICSFSGTGKVHYQFSGCRIPARFYGSLVEVSLDVDTWVPAILWPHTSNDVRTLGIDFKELWITPQP